MENDIKVLKKGASPWPIFLFGAALGAAAGLMLAPDAGKESRRRLAQWIKEKRAKSREGWLTKKTQVEAAIEAGQKAYSEKKLAGV